VFLVTMPGAAVAIATMTVATGLNLATAIILNMAVGAAVSSVLFLAVQRFARQLASEWTDQTHAAASGLSRQRTQLLSIYDDEVGLYADWYFRLRIKEEIARALRYGGQVAVLLVESVPLVPAGEEPAAHDERAEQISGHLRRSDLPALLRDGCLGIIMPNTTRRAASTVRRRIIAALTPREPASGLSCFPEDGADASTLLAAADQELRQLRELRDSPGERASDAA
jgi:GGDEF domain-containing protein